MSLLYKKLVLGEMATNSYLCWNERTKECLIVDPGDEGEEISQEIENLGLKPVMIVVTHGHFDHVMAGLDLKLIYNIPFACSSKDGFLLKRQDKTAEFFLKRKVGVPEIKIDISLDKIKKIKLGEEEIKIIKTPGHSPGGVCFYVAGQNLLFSGDTLFKNAIGRTDFSYGSKKELEKSLKKLSKLPEKTKVLPGHGEEFFGCGARIRT
ncbi:MBL fold metallo-hydrolase [Patescibacteria group bacterium]|nr:MBL fold metallo-hydrolase [Patescibacteria group bacterium]